MLIFFSQLDTTSNWLLAYIYYKLSETFITWSRQYILGDWNPINKYRSLVLAFIGYAEIIFLYAVIAFLFREYLIGINCTTQAFYYSVRNAVTIGASNIIPQGFVGYAIYVSQLMFTILFLTSVISRIIGRKQENV
jgi:hypothetical protein